MEEFYARPKPQSLEEHDAETRLKAARAKSSEQLSLAVVRCTQLAVDHDLVLDLVDASDVYIAQARKEVEIVYFYSFLQKILDRFDHNDELSANVFVKWLIRNIRFLTLSYPAVLFLEPGTNTQAIFVFWILMKDSSSRYSACPIETLPIFSGTALDKIVLPKIIDYVKSVRVRFVNPAKETYLANRLFPLRLTLSPTPLLKKMIYIHEPDQWFTLDSKELQVDHERFPLPMKLESCHYQESITSIAGLTLEIWSGTLDTEGRARREQTLKGRGNGDFQLDI